MTLLKKVKVSGELGQLQLQLQLVDEPSGLRPALGGEGRRENTQTESKRCRLLAEMALSVVRKNPRKHAVVGQKKPTPKGWFFLYWWRRRLPNANFNHMFLLN